MRSLSEGAANFELVASRLAKSSESLEEVAYLYQSAIVESGWRSAQVVDTLRTQFDKLPDASTPPEQLSQSLADTQRAFESIAELNPFQPRSPREP